MVIPRSLVNGRNATTIDLGDRGLQYGDGLFETVLVQEARPLFFPRHLRRLKLGCRRLGIPYPGDPVLQGEVQALCRGAREGVLKIQLTRGSGGRGYRPPIPARPTRILRLFPAPEHPPSQDDSGIALGLCRTRLGINRRLAGIKHLNRLEQVLARGEWEDQGIAEGLMLDPQGHVIEGTMSNLFLVRRGELWTPRLTCCGVVGIMRSLVIDEARKRGGAVHIGNLTLSDVSDADELFITNSIIRLWPVTWFQGIRYPLGPVTRAVRGWIEGAIQKELAP